MKREIEEKCSLTHKTHTFQRLYLHFYIIDSHYEIISAFFSHKQGTGKKMNSNVSDFLESEHLFQLSEKKELSEVLIDHNEDAKF